MTGIRLAALLSLSPLLLFAQEVRNNEPKVSEFTLANGLHFIVLERHQAPVLSFHTYVNAGWIHDPAGRTGLAHLMEHLAFKGTETVGTRNWPAEKQALDELDSFYRNFEAEHNKGVRASPGKLAPLEADIKLASNAAGGITDTSEYLRAFQENGAVGINCHTSADACETSYSLPSNRIELWFLMESQRLAHPVFRDVYKERDAMLLEAKTTVDSKSQAKLQQALLSTAFTAHPYRNPGLGWASDVGSLDRGDVKNFFDTYYVPGNMAIGIAGDVDPANAQRLAERYFGPLLAKPLPPLLSTVEPQQWGPKSVVLIANSPPLMMMGYKRPDQTNRDDITFDVIRMLLADGRMGTMYKELVEDKKLAQSVDAVATYPGGRYPNLFIFTIAPAGNHSLEENQRAFDDLLARFQSTPVDAQSLERVKNTLRARVLRSLASNQQLAALLPNFYFNYGDWRKLFAVSGDIGRVTAADVQRVVVQYFTSSNKTIALITNAAQQSGGARGAQ